MYAIDLLEMVMRKVVWREGQRKVKKVTDRPGYKMEDGQEQKMSIRELIKRRKGAKRSAKKKKSKQQQIIRKRERTMMKRGDQ